MDDTIVDQDYSNYRMFYEFSANQVSPEVVSELVQAMRQTQQYRTSSHEEETISPEPLLLQFFMNVLDALADGLKQELARQLMRLNPGTDIVFFASKDIAIEVCNASPGSSDVPEVIASALLLENGLLNNSHHFLFRTKMPLSRFMNEMQDESVSDDDDTPASEEGEDGEPLMGFIMVDEDDDSPEED